MPPHNATAREGQRICLPSILNAVAHSQLLHQVYEALAEEHESLVLDFSSCIKAYQDGVVPTICTTDFLREFGIAISVILPSTWQLASLFHDHGWAHLLSPTEFPLTAGRKTGLSATRFQDPSAQKQIVDSMVDLVMGQMELSRDALAGLEWTFNELTDNVLNHAEAPDGGIAQGTIFPKSREIHLIVADAGQGILNSLKEGFPELGTDEQAIGEAVKEGVTRNADAGQGNGLAGSLRIAAASGGRFQVLSGRAYFQVFVDSDTKDVQSRMAPRSISARFHGTAVYVRLNLDHPFVLAEALDFGGGPYQPSDWIETKYANTDHDLVLLVGDETIGFGSRAAGLALRTKCKNHLAAEPGSRLALDWTGIPIVSSSFADEAIGRLFRELGPLEFSRRVAHRGMEPTVRQLVDRAIIQRMRQD